MFKINTLLKTECKENTFLENNQVVILIFAKTINNTVLILRKKRVFYSIACKYMLIFDSMKRILTQY
ncbi:hypothetical protein FH5T_18500 [Draconibacterium orientale]|uniref:Uncharacterized protein n=1 Tax=Draconibacterium orientale TaxID=1168034 RepID=A0ABM5QEV6_9BACT|nr:hypothetical protein FH5T_18500 [Draconibacterium orientale]